MKESDLQRKIIKAIEKKGGYVFKVITANRAGIPDVIACIDGLFYAIEVKMPKGRVSAIQDYNLDKITQAGGKAIVARSVEDFLENCL